MRTDDLVSVVIPTRNRSHLVGRAVASVLAQTWRSIEVIVVIDGPDEATASALGRIEDPRLKIEQLPASNGAQMARNHGVRAARGWWIAFLDDDDEWLPEKLDRQMVAARACTHPLPIVSCGLISQAPDHRTEWPSRAPRSDESIADYLFFRDKAEVSEIRLQTSTLMMPKALLLVEPWRIGHHDEFDLLLRTAKVEGAGLAFASGPMVIWHSDAGPQRLSIKEASAKRTADWLRSMRGFMSRRTYARFLLVTVSAWARNENDWRLFWSIPADVVRYGYPTAGEIVEHLGRWLLPQGLRKLIGGHLRARAQADGSR